jgi:hypothetical protein
MFGMAVLVRQKAKTGAVCAGVQSGQHSVHFRDINKIKYTRELFFSSFVLKIPRTMLY